MENKQRDRQSRKISNTRLYKSFFSVTICFILFTFLMSSCRQIIPSSDSATQVIPQEGGLINLPGGVSATFGDGFFRDGTSVTVSLSDAPLAYPPEIARAYQGGEPVARSVQVSFPARALTQRSGFAEQPQLTVRVPAVTPRLEEEDRLLAEVHLLLADGTHLVFFEPYARVDSDVGQTFDGADSVTIRSGQFRADGVLTEEITSVIVRPVRLKNDKLTLQAVPTGFTIEDAGTGLNNGVAFDFAPDNRIFVATKNGLVRVVENGRTLTAPFVDLRSEVNSYHDRGMLGIAVHPQFPQQPYIYVLYTYDPPEVQGQSGLGGPDNGGARVARLLRLTADSNLGYNEALPGSEAVLLGKNSTFANIGDPATRNSLTPSCGPLNNYVQDCLPADEWSHTVGSLRFGSDGSLFVSNGDGANYIAVGEYVERSLDLDSLAGKILRINPLTGQGYNNNPFFNGDPDSNRSKVFNLGLRNPFRFTMDKTTNLPYVGDVGWNTWEEVNSGRGKNFGWPCYEGGHRTSLEQGGYRSLARCASLYANPDVTPAIYAYSHGNGGSSVQVGDFYTGTRYPAQYREKLFVSDFDQGTISVVDTVTGIAAPFSSEMAGITQISAGPQGDLYIMNIYAEVIWRLRYNAPDTIPIVAKATADPLQGAAPLTVNFSSAGSQGTGALSYLWNFGDNETSSEANPSHIYSENGVYTVTLNVTDDAGESATSTLTVRVGNTPPTAIIMSPADNTTFNIGDLIAFSGRGTDQEEGDLPETALSWSIKMHHNEHVHPDGLPPTTGATGSFVVDDHGDNTYLELCLTAADAFSETSTSCVTLKPNTVTYTLDTVPTGLQLPWEGRLRTTPYNVTTNVNALQQLIAPAQQGEYTFINWSDGGAREHNITIGSTAGRLVATYVGPPTPQKYIVDLTTAPRTILSSLRVGSGVSYIGEAQPLGTGIGVRGLRIVNGKLQTGNQAKALSLYGNKRLTVVKSGTNVPNPTGGRLEIKPNQVSENTILKRIVVSNITRDGASINLYRSGRLFRRILLSKTALGASRTINLSESSVSLIEVTVLNAFAVDDITFEVP